MHFSVQRSTISSIISPRSGDCFEIMKDAKYKYKLAVRDAANEFEGRLDDELLNSYLHNDF